MIRIAAWVLSACLAMSGVAYAELRSTLAPASPAPGGERRVALVIGNSAYKGAPLRNPVNDARAMAKALAGTGFEVLLVEDAGRAGMHRAIRDFGDSLLRGGVGLFYFAGHGMQVRNRNYLVPVDVEIEREDEVEFQAVDANLVLSKMDSARNSANIVILDACRNNPFHRSFKLSSSGLAQMDAAAGTLIAFATAPGQVAADGEGENGLYTSHLLKALRQPGLPVEQLFKQVRNGVMADTKERQVPWESSSLRGDFFFLAPDPAAGATIQQAVIDKAVADAVREAEARAAKEREALQAETKKLIDNLLARQRAELDAELRARGAVQAAADPAPPAARVATPAPARTPAVGDAWEYRVGPKDMPARQSLLRVAVKAVLDDGVIESRQSAAGGGDWVYRPTVEIIGTGNPSAYNLAPYLLAFHDVKVGDAWQDIPFQRLGNCSTHPSWSCRFDARVVAKEMVTVPAGSFDAFRIEVTQTVIPAGPGVERRATYWFAPQVKRNVKVTWRTISGSWAAADMDAVLVSYKLN